MELPARLLVGGWGWNGIGGAPSHYRFCRYGNARFVIDHALWRDTQLDTNPSYSSCIQYIPSIHFGSESPRHPTNGPQSTFNSEEILVVSPAAALVVPLHHVAGPDRHPLNILVVF